MLVTVLLLSLLSQAAEVVPSAVPPDGGWRSGLEEGAVDAGTRGESTLAVADAGNLRPLAPLPTGVPDWGSTFLGPNAGESEDAEPERGGSGATSDSTRFGDTRGYLGASFGGGFVADLGSSRGAQLQFALHAGVWTHHFNLDLEVAPGTDVAIVRGPFFVRMTPVASGLARVSIAGVVTLLDRGASVEHPWAVSVGWSFRLWTGFSWPSFRQPWGTIGGEPAVPGPGLSLQFSLLGLVVRTGHLQLELNAFCPMVAIGNGFWGGYIFPNASAVWLF